MLLVLAFVFWKVDLPVPSTFCKFGAYALFGFLFLQFFQELSWVVLVAALIPLVDAYSVWRGPTNDITEHHEEVFSGVAVRSSPPAAASRSSARPTSRSSPCSWPRASVSACARSGRGSA